MESNIGSRSGSGGDVRLLSESPFDPLAILDETPDTCRTALVRFGRSTTAKVIGHPLTKATGGALVGIATHTALLGEHGDYFAIGGAGLWLISTMMSTCYRPRMEGVIKHLAQSVGYGVAGGPLALLYLATRLCCRKESTDPTDVEAIMRKIDSPVAGLERT